MIRRKEIDFTLPFPGFTMWRRNRRQVSISIERILVICCSITMQYRINVHGAWLKRLLGSKHASLSSFFKRAMERQFNRHLPLGRLSRSRRFPRGGFVYSEILLGQVGILRESLGNGCILSPLHLILMAVGSLIIVGLAEGRGLIEVAIHLFRDIPSADIAHVTVALGTRHSVATIFLDNLDLAFGAVSN